MLMFALAMLSCKNIGSTESSDSSYTSGVHHNHRSQSRFGGAHHSHIGSHSHMGHHGHRSHGHRSGGRH